MQILADAHRQRPDSDKDGVLIVTSHATANDQDQGPGLFQRFYADGTSVVTNIRLAGEGRKAGSGLINFATGLLFALAIGLFAVSVNAQFTYIFSVKHSHGVSVIEAISLDAAMAIFSLLALGLARVGKAAKIERALVLVCALASAGMNYAAANVLSPRSIVAYIAPPLLLAVVVDRVVAVVRRHVLGEDETSPWRPVGRAALYLLRMAIAPLSTLRGARQAVLNAAPVPEKPAKAEPVKTIPAVVELPRRGPIEPVPARPAIERAKPRTKTARKKSSSRKRTGGPSKASQLITLAIDKHGLVDLPLSEVSALATRLSEEVNLHPATARKTLIRHARALQNGGAE